MYLGLDIIIGYIFIAIIEVQKFLMESIYNIFLKGMNENIAIALLGIEAGLMVLHYAFLPMLLDNRSKEYYLGYKASDILLYRNLDTKWNDVNINWIANVVIIILEIVLLQYKAYSTVFILFIVFITLISKKIINYTKFITNPNIFDKKIEKIFIEAANKNNRQIADNIMNELSESTKGYKKTINFLLENLNNPNIKSILEELYKRILDEHDNKKIYDFYSCLSNKIKEGKNELDFIVMDYDWYNFLKENVNEQNQNALFIMSIYIYENNIKVYKEHRYNYALFIKNTQEAIDASNLSKNTKDEWFKRIFKNIFTNIRIKNILKEPVKYENAIEFIKYVIDSKEANRLNELYKEMSSLTTFPEDILHILIAIYVYLIYLTEYENEKFISEEDRKYYSDVLKEITDKINTENMKIYNAFSTDDIIKIFNIIYPLCLNWERMTDWVLKELNIEQAYTILKRIFIIYSKMKHFDLYPTIDEKELEIFAGSFEGTEFSSSNKETILKISSKLKIPIDSNILEQYAKNLVTCATKKYKNNELASTNEYNKQLEKLMELEETLKNNLAKIEIFNNYEFEKKNTLKLTVENSIYRKDMFRYEVDGILKNPAHIIELIESEIYAILESKLDNKIDYNFEAKKLLQKLIEYKDKKYVYLTSLDDDYNKDYMLGEKYTDVVNNYNVVHTNIRNDKIIINKLEVKFNKIEINAIEPNEKEIEKEIENYKISKNKYQFLNNNYGYYIEFNKEEITKYVKKNFVKFSITCFVEFGDYSGIDGCHLSYKFM